jgi:hypothetical protein
LHATHRHETVGAVPDVDVHPAASAHRYS